MKKALMLAMLMSLSACGGSGGSSPDPEPVKTPYKATLTLTKLDLSNANALVTAKPTGIQRVKAQTNAVTLPENVDDAVTRQMILGEISKLPIEWYVVEEGDEENVSCSQEVIPEIFIRQVYEVKTSWYLANTVRPTTQDAQCNFTFVVEDYLVDPEGYAHLVTQPLENITGVIKAGDQTRNSTNDPVVVANGVANTIKLIDGAVVVTPISARDPSYNGKGKMDNNFVFTGDYSVQSSPYTPGSPGGNQTLVPTVYVFNVATQTETEVVATDVFESYSSFIYLDNDLDIIWNAYNDEAQKDKWVKVDPASLTLTPKTSKHPVTLYSVKGRFDTLLLGDRCETLNTETGELSGVDWSVFGSPEYFEGVFTSGTAESYASDAYSYCVSRYKQVIGRKNLTTGETSVFNATEQGVQIVSYQIGKEEVSMKVVPLSQPSKFNKVSAIDTETIVMWNFDTNTLVDVQTTTDGLEVTDVTPL